MISKDVTMPHGSTRFGDPVFLFDDAILTVNSRGRNDY